MSYTNKYICYTCICIHQIYNEIHQAYIHVHLQNTTTNHNFHLLQCKNYFIPDQKKKKRVPSKLRFIEIFFPKLFTQGYSDGQ